MDLSGNITFYNATGKSLIDYLLVEPSRMDSVKTLSSGNFNTVSHLAPHQLWLIVRMPPSYY